MATRRTFTKALALGPLMLPGLRDTLAQARYPAKQIQMVVGFPPGQSSDIGARNIARHMSDVLKQTVFVENKPGASTIIGHQYLKAAVPDGYTIGYSSTGPLAINPTLYKKLPYDAANKGIRTKEALDFFAKNGSEPKGGTPEECAAYMKRERDKWAPVIIASGAQVD